MKISIISVSTGSKTSAKGKTYQNAEVIFKNIDSGKVENKNITQYSDVYKQVAEAQPQQVYNVSLQKDDQGYWQWTSFERVVGESAPPSAAASPAPAASRWQGETAEERAAKQIYIVRQSSLSAAVAALSVGAKVPPSAKEVISYADQLVHYVLDLPGKKDVFDLPNDLEVQ